MSGKLTAPERETFATEGAYRSVYQFYGLMAGESEWGAPASLTSFDDDTLWAVTIFNNGTTGRHLNIPGILQASATGVSMGVLSLVTLTVTGNTILGDAAGDLVTVNATPTFNAASTFKHNVTIQNSAGTVLGAFDVTAGAQKVTLGAAAAPGLYVDVQNARTLIGSTTALGSATDDKLSVIGGAAHIATGISGVALGIRYGAAGASWTVESTAATNPDLVFKGDTGTELFRLADASAIYQAVVTGGLHVTGPADFDGDVGLGNAAGDAIDVGGTATFLNPSLFPNGAVGTPSLAFSADPDTGFYRVTTSTGRIGVACDGTKVLEIVNNGSTFGLGIGMAPSLPLDVQRSSTDYVARIDQTSSSSGAKVLYLKSAATGATDEVLRVESNTLARLIVEGSGAVFIGDTSNAGNTIGLTVNQAGNDDEILSLKSSDVGHGVTSVTETDTYVYVRKLTAASGGAQIATVDGTSTASMLLRGIVGAASTTRSTAAVAPVIIEGALKSGTTVASVGANQNIVTFRDFGTTRFILDSDGDSHQDVGTAWTNFHGHDDMTLVAALAANVTRPSDPIRADFGQFLFERREELERLRLVQFNDDGHHFVNMSRLSMLLVGAVQQIATRLDSYDQRFLALESP